MEKQKKSIIDPKEQEIRLSFHNYKLLKKEDFVLKNSCIYFIKGPNNVGKTSILNALKAAMEIKDDTPQKVSRGESEGENEFLLPGPDGKMYSVRYEFTDTTTKFVIFDPDGNKISKISEMRDIFKYNHVSADSFIEWSRSAEGRRRQKQMILELLPPEVYVKYHELETDEKNLFERRTIAGKEKEKYEGLRKEYELTSEQKEIQQNKERAKKALKIKEDELKALTESDNQRTQLTGKIIEINGRMEMLTKAFNDNAESQKMGISSAKNRIAEFKRQIAELEGKIVKEEEYIVKVEDALKAKQSALDDELSKLKPQIEEHQAALKKIPEASDPLEYGEKVAALEVKIKNGQEYIRKSEEYTVRLLNYQKYDSLATEAITIYDGLDQDIQKIRMEKERIITEGNFPVDNLTFDEEGYLYIDGFKFDEKQVCESDTILLVAQLLCKMNVSPIQIIGDASVLDYSRLDRLYDIAEKNGKIMFVDEIDRDLDKLVIVGYERHDKTGKKNEKKLEFE